MFVATIPNRKSPPSILLRRTYREGKNVRVQTIANITKWKPERIEALRRALKGEFDNLEGKADITYGTIFGVLFVLKHLADQLGITQALGRTKKAKLALFLILARIAHKGSRLSATRWAKQHAVEDILGIYRLDEDDLYEALDDIESQQVTIEQKLYKEYVKKSGSPPALVLYDVTSSYFEGEKNELAEYGYNRDGKKGKKQIVIGLITAEDGEPLAIRVFRGNTSDPSTVFKQIELLKDQFGVKEVVFVGDRGMVKNKCKEGLTEEGFKYITALTNAQVRTLLQKGCIHIDIFDTDIQEVEYEGKRFILRRNDAVRYKEQQRRNDKLQQLNRLIEARNRFVSQSKRANPESGLNKLKDWIKRYRVERFVTLHLEEREICIKIDNEAMEEAALLDGCYVMETNVKKSILDCKTVDARYRDLQLVERDFRRLKTNFLEVRPIFVRKSKRTKGHVFTAMLALKIIRSFEKKLKQAFGTTNENKYTPTVDDALSILSRIIFLNYDVGKKRTSRLSKPDDQQVLILDALGLSLPVKAKMCRQ